jgi:hypothetical protein
MLPTFKTLDEIPEAFRAGYEERDGEWHPIVPEEAGEALKSALEKERQNAATAETARKALEKELREFKAKEQQQRHGLTEEQLKQVREDVRAELIVEFEDQVKELSSKAETGEKTALELRSAVKAMKVREVLQQNGARGARVPVLEKIVTEEFDLVDNEKLILKGKPANDIAKHVSDNIKKNYPEFFEGTAADGGGAGGIQDGAAPAGATMSVADILKNPGAAISAGLQAGAPK